MAYLLLAPTEKDPKTRLIKTLLICEKAVYPLTEKEAIEELQNKKKMQERIDRIKKDLGWIQ